MANVQEFPGQIIISSSSNQLGLGKPESAFYSTISCPAPSANRTLTIPDPGANCNVQLGVVQTVVLTPAASITLTTAQSGSLILMPSDTVGSAINLPAVASGLNYRIVFQAVADGSHTTTIQITSTPANLKGHISNVATGAYTSTVLPASTIVRSATAANTKVGDCISVWCDGTNYWVEGTGVGTAATFSVT